MCTLREAVTFLLNEANLWGSDGILTDDEYLKAAIDFANDADPASVEALMSGGRPQCTADTQRLTLPDPPYASEDERKEARQRIREVMEEILNGSLSKDSKVFLGLCTGRMVLVPEPALSRATNAYRRIPLTLHIALGYAVAYLWRTRLSLRRCELPECQRFFITDKRRPGRPREKFCTKAHMLELHDRGAPERVRKSRKRKKTLARNRSRAKH